MGYPLRLHPAYTFVERLIELQNRRRVSRNSLAFYHSDVEGLLGHPYLAGAESAGNERRSKSGYVYINAARLRTTPLLEKIFSAPEAMIPPSPIPAPPDGDCRGSVGELASSMLGWQALSDYLIEVVSEVARSADTGFFAIIVDHIRLLANSLDGCGVELSPKVYASLLRRSLQSVSVPFEGEPLEGVQVMGILETRALDFENIIFLSASDSFAPGNLTGAPSFIPYNLKMAYGLPTPEHHEGVWAYHLFRLISRARNVDMVWSSTIDERSAGEPSRYILQLDYESPHEVEKESITVDVNLSPREPIVVEKGSEVMAALEEFLRTKEPRTLSPSLFYSYVECPLKFYFRAVARLHADEEPTEEVDNAMFGNILHHAMRRLYTPLVGAANPQAQIRAMVGSDAVEKAVTEAVTELYAKEEGLQPEDWGGNIMLVHKTIVDYINRNILPFDAGISEGYTITALERELAAEVAFGDEPDGGGRRVLFRGFADRIDRLNDGTLRIIDYKTGSPKNNASALLQMRLYAMMARPETVEPILYYIREMSKPDYRPLTVEPEPEMEESLRTTLAGLFDAAVPFTQTADLKPCQWCDFRAICGR
jgi:RecB family exonuclease